MTTPIATLGTPTTHGGMVTTASSNLVIDGRPAARVGDTVTCPLHGPGVITGGGLGAIEGRNIAHHGSSTTCGATLIVAGGGPTV
ncbi:PAAR domain-containing protein [Caballeronia sp. NK8]|uniref:PAAR domain-containing protein n=1 Tax=Caballeronia sp. NK8 TaxID=140098 RepID=UPI001BD18F76|nr:PAAR domain-containing protein [Caballeronia sp. NK8]